VKLQVRTIKQCVPIERKEYYLLILVLQVADVYNLYV